MIKQSVNINGAFGDHILLPCLVHVSSCGGANFSIRHLPPFPMFSPPPSSHLGFPVMYGGGVSASTPPLQSIKIDFSTTITPPSSNFTGSSHFRQTPLLLRFHLRLLKLEKHGTIEIFRQPNMSFSFIYFSGRRRFYSNLYCQSISIFDQRILIQIAPKTEILPQFMNNCFLAVEICTLSLHCFPSLFLCFLLCSSFQLPLLWSIWSFASSGHRPFSKPAKPAFAFSSP